MSRIQIKRGRRSRLVWINPQVDERAERHLTGKSLEGGIFPTRTKTEAAMGKFVEMMETALYGNYDYPEKLEYLTRKMERLRIDLLNFERVDATSTL